MWSSCSKPCGGGKKSRRFHLPHSAVAAVASGVYTCAMANNEVQEVACNERACVAADCEGAWGEWSDCSNSCGAGKKTRAYAVIKRAGHGGEECTHADGRESLLTQHRLVFNSTQLKNEFEVLGLRVVCTVRHIGGGAG